MVTQKISVIGLDGATFNVLEPMMRRGILPNISKLVENGASGNLETYITGMGQGWASFMTGKDPTKTGIFYWILQKGITSSHITDQTLWQILSNNEKTVGIVNVPYTFPPKPVKGFLIAGLGGGITPDKKAIFTYPEDLYFELKHELGRYERGWLSFDKEEPNAYVRKIMEVTELQGKASEYLLKKYRPDFFMVVFRAMDSIQHSLWSQINLSTEHENISKTSNYIDNCYMMIDNIIGNLIKIASDSNIFILSDHGFIGSKKIFLINEFLSEKGYLIKTKGVKKHLVLKPLRRTKRLIGPIYNKLRTIERFRKIDKARTRVVNFGKEVINWDKTVAFGDSFYGVSLNKSGKNVRAALGSNKERDQLCRQIIQDLREVVCPDTGEHIFAEVYKKQELKSFKHAELLPDILCVPNDGYDCSLSVDISRESTSCLVDISKEAFKFGQGIHARDGIFIVNGEHIKKQTKIDGVQITDLSATILHLMDIPIPSDMDGRVLSEITVD